MGNKFTGPKSLIKFEKEYAKFLVYVIEQASSQFKNNTILSLNKTTINKFADAKQTGNYSTIFQKLSEQVQRKILKRFTDDKIYKATKAIFDQIDASNSDKMYAAAASAMGVDIKYVLNKELKKPNTLALIKSTSEWASKTLDESLQMYSANTLRAMTLGQDLDDITKQFDGMVEKRKGHAAMVARTQVSTFNGIVTKVRAQNLGVSKAIWMTSEDERVRPSHKQRDGKQYDVSKGLYSSIDGKFLIPGVDYNCRCVAEYVLPDDF